jgi:hypothetical protein
VTGAWTVMITKADLAPADANLLLAYGHFLMSLDKRARFIKDPDSPARRRSRGLESRSGARLGRDGVREQFEAAQFAGPADKLGGQGPEPIKICNHKVPFSEQPHADEERRGHQVT